MNSPHRMARRAFLRRTGSLTAASALAATAPNIFLNRSLAQTGAPPSEAIRIGIVGVGGQGKSHINAITKNVAAICDVDKKRLTDVAADLEKRTGKSPATYSDYRKMLENKDLDAILIAVPDHWHALIAIHACQAGKDVYVEKPLTLTVREGIAMIKAARYYKRIVQCGSQQRSDAKFRQGCELVRNGRIGDIQVVRVGLPGVNYSQPTLPDSAPPPELDYDMWLGPAPARPYNKNRVHYNFRFFWAYSGGQMTNWGAHHLDIAQWGLGTDETGPVEISARAEFDQEKRFEVPTWFEIEYKYSAKTSVLCGQSHRIGTTFEGQDGLIYVNRGKFETTYPNALKEPITDQDTRLYVSNNHHQNWFDCIKSRKLPICDVEIGHRSATVCHLGNLAVRLGRTIKWDPVKQEILGDAEAASHLHYEYRAPWKLPEVG